MNASPRSLAGAALTALLLFPVSALSAPPPIPPGQARQGRFEVIKTYADGPWLVPTLQAIRSPDAWNAQMAKWQAEETVVGREDPPSVNWNHEFVVVLSLGSQIGECGVKVRGCTVRADTTEFDLQFLTPPQWDPWGSIEHPAVLIAVDRADLKNLKIRFDCEINGLPTGQGRRTYGFGANSDVAPAPSAESVDATLEANTTWGRLKDSYRR